MSHLPNWKEYGQAGQTAQKDVTEIYDATYGKYDDKASVQKPSKPLPPETFPHPFTTRGG